MNSRARVLFIAAVMVTVANAADFSTKPARDAEAIYNRELRTAEESYAKAKAAAHRKYVKSLDDAAKAAAMAGNLDEVQRIGEEKGRLDAEAQPVDNRKLWVSPGKVFFQMLDDGQWVAIQASGGVILFREAHRDSDKIEIHSVSGGQVTLTNGAATLRKSGKTSNYPAGDWKGQ